MGHTRRWAEFGYALQDAARRAHIQVLRRSQVDLLPPLVEEVLRHVIERPGVRVQDLADHLAIAPANASGAVRRLTSLGLVAKSPDPDDARAVRLQPTAKALAGRDEVDAAWSELYRQAAAELDPPERDALLAAVPALRRLAQVLAVSELR